MSQRPPFGDKKLSALPWKFASRALQRATICNQSVYPVLKRPFRDLKHLANPAKESLRAERLGCAAFVEKRNKQRPADLPPLKGPKFS